MVSGLINIPYLAYSVQAYFNPLRNIEMALKIKAAYVRASF